MNGRTHLITGLAVGVVIATQIQIDPIQQLTINSAKTIPQFLGVLAAAAGGALLPDIDHPQSIISGWLPGSGLLRLATRHRGITHSWVILAWLGFWSSFGQPVLGLAFMAGIVSHLVLDMLTPEGVQLFWPVPGFWRVPIVTLIPVWLWESVITTGCLGLMVWMVVSKL